MKFEEALPLLKQGKKIRRRRWAKIEYVEKRNGYVVQKMRDGKEVSCCVEFYDLDILAEDWEVME